MDMHTFSVINRKRSEAPNGFNHPLSKWSLSDWFLATLGELGEAANIAKKLNRYRDGIAGNQPTDTEDNLKAKLKREIADAFTYLDLTSQAAGFSLEDAVRSKFDEKSAEIGYPLQLTGKTEYPVTWWTAYDENAESFYNECATREEAIEAAKRDEHPWIVSAAGQSFNLTINGGSILELLAGYNEELVNEDGDFMEAVTDEETRDLGVMMTATLRDWMIKHEISGKAWALTEIGNWEKVINDNVDGT